MTKKADGSYVYSKQIPEDVLSELREAARALSDEMGAAAYCEMLAKVYEQYKDLLADVPDNPIHEFMRQYRKAKARKRRKKSK